MSKGYSKVGRSSIWEAPGLEDALRRHYATGLSCSGIAAAINREFGVQFTRSAVIGKVHRLKLEPRRTDVGRFVRQKRRPRPRIAKIFKIPSSAGTSRASRMKAQREHVQTLAGALKTFDTHYDDAYCRPEERVSLLDLRPSQCRWPYGHEDYRFCGKPAHDGSYCQYHANVSAYGVRGAAALMCEAAE